LDYSNYINAWQLLKEKKNPIQNSIESSFHSIIQGRLIEIGNIRGFKTFCPDKTKKFNGTNLEDLSTIKKFPTLEFADYDSLKQIDVIWFREKVDKLIPESAFEVELSTGTWPGVGRLATLLDYSAVRLLVISDDKKKYNQAMNSFYENMNRYKHIQTDLIGESYSAELNLKELRIEIGL
jgi:hypothetical protein